MMPFTEIAKWKAYFGEIVQMDGSHHDWLEGCGTKNRTFSFCFDKLKYIS